MNVWINNVRIPFHRCTLVSINALKSLRPVNTSPVSSMYVTLVRIPSGHLTWIWSLLSCSRNTTNTKRELNIKNAKTDLLRSSISSLAILACKKIKLCRNLSKWATKFLASVQSGEWKTLLNTIIIFNRTVVTNSVGPRKLPLVWRRHMLY